MQKASSSTYHGSVKVSHQRGFAAQILDWWRANRKNKPLIGVLQDLLSGVGQFMVDSLPSRRRQRYGDIDFDWDHRVDTTGATVTWRERLLGTLHSPYQPTEPKLFREMLESLKVDFRGYTFIDLGSGKGRTLLMASEYPFRRIIGVELLPPLHTIAGQNIAKFRSECQKCFELESICADATEFAFPPEPTVLYLFNPLPESGLARVLKNLEESLQEKPRPLFALYHNPEHGDLFSNSFFLERLLQTHSYSIFASKR